MMEDNDNNNNNKKEDQKDKFEEKMESKNMKFESGTIKCKKCSYKLGEFSPKGTQCSCGSWVVPAVQIVKSKVDKIKNIKMYILLYIFFYLILFYLTFCTLSTLDLTI